MRARAPTGRSPNIGHIDTVHIVIDGEEIAVSASSSIAAVLVQRRVHESGCAEPTGAGVRVFCGMGSCYACVVTVDGAGGVRSCISPVLAGMVIQTGTRDHGPK